MVNGRFASESLLDHTYSVDAVQGLALATIRMLPSIRTPIYDVYGQSSFYSFQLRVAAPSIFFSWLDDETREKERHGQKPNSKPFQKMVQFVLVFQLSQLTCDDIGY